MTNIDPHGPSTDDAEFEGVGNSVDAALHDAMLVANRSTGDMSGVRAEVVSWGIDAIGIGGARSFWVRVRCKTVSR